MLVIKIELWPFGRKENAKTLFVGTVGNDLSGTSTSGNYNVRLYQKGSAKKIWKEGRVEGFPRSKKNAWYLILEALKACIDE